MARGFKSINSTFIFKEFDKALNLSNKILEIMTSAKELSIDNLGDNIVDIEKRFSYSMKNKVITDLRVGRITPVFYTKDSVKIPNGITAFMGMTGGRIKCYANLSNFGSFNGTKLNIEPKKLYQVLQDAEILLTCYEKPEIISRDDVLCKKGSNMFAHIFTRVLNKMFSLNTTPEKFDKVLYLSSKYFLVNLLGRDYYSDEINSNIAMANCKSINALVLKELNSKIDLSAFQNFDTFIKALTENVPGLEKLTTRGYIDAFISMYGPSTMLALEWLPAFLNTIFSVVVGSFMNNQYILENIIGNDVDILYNNFNKVISVE